MTEWMLNTVALFQLWAGDRQTDRHRQTDRVTYGSRVHPSGQRNDWFHHRRCPHWHTAHHHSGTDCQTDRQTDWWYLHIQTDRHTDRRTNRQTDTLTHRPSSQRYWLPDRQTDRQTDVQTDRHTNTQPMQCIAALHSCTEYKITWCVRCDVIYGQIFSTFETQLQRNVH